MPRASSAPRHPGSRLTYGALRADEWEHVTSLPAEVMIAAIGLLADPPGRTVAEGLAGLDAIAAGRISDSDLVRAVVAAIFAEQVADRPSTAPVRDGSRVLADCRRVAEILRARVELADANAYRHWVQQIAVRVFAASRSGGVFRLPGERLGGAQRAFLDRLAAALA
jgi:hypothetical protein